jgi:sec-independent protein translocase protein TatA
LIPAFLSLPGNTEWLVIGIFALLIFGKRLPEVARSLGKGVVEFKKGLRGLEEEVEQAGQERPPASPQLEGPAARSDQTAPPGEPPPKHDTTT